ncbi:hypothetical protein VCB98_07985 [Gammaproteobacteria bacterium AB-CW1]|uniref:Big-1 domain-containing protein n=1 Tax=Natronospira elongata TaxID=3110268 RepID=A0AAP6JEX3_9GAMM|nr:hypothetical protein [Gammaproteobacteria bacterium AB-CW1]
MIKRILLALLLAGALAMVACDNDEGSISQAGGDNGEENGNGDDNGDDNGDPSAGGLVMGSGDGEDFEAGQLTLGMSSIAAGGSTGISGRILTEDGDVPDDEFEVELTSNCADEGLASLTSPVATNGGEFSSTYTAEGCQGEDTITAQASIDGVGTLSASASVEVAAANLGSLVFMSADPQLIGLRGMGVPEIGETSTVRFRVEDVNGNPTPGREVQFTLSTSVGGIELSNDSAVSNDQGEVSTQVISGTVATPVRVNAQVVDTTVSSQSSLLSISTGIAEQQGVSIAFESLNPPVQGCVGEEYEITVHARDRFSNPVIDGTVINFSTEGGRIQPHCMTVDGTCVVTWTSQASWPARSTVLAYLEGEESFIDRTGDGLFGPAEAAEGPHEGDFDPNDPEGNADIGWIDVGEPFRDDNESGEYEPGVDGFHWNYYGGGYTEANELFDGALCGAGIEDDGDRETFQNDYCGSPQAPIGVSGVMVLADNRVVNMAFPTTYVVGSGPLEIELWGPEMQPLPSGSTVAFDTGYGRVLGQDTITIGNTNQDGPIAVEFTLSESNEDDTTECDVGTITVTTPGNSCGEGFIFEQELTICGSDS